MLKVVNEKQIPSGDVRIAMGKWLDIVDFLIQNGGSFHSDVKLPEGDEKWTFQDPKM